MKKSDSSKKLGKKRGINVSLDDYELLCSFKKKLGDIKISKFNLEFIELFDKIADELKAKTFLEPLLMKKGDPEKIYKVSNDVLNIIQKKKFLRNCPQNEADLEFVVTSAISDCLENINLKTGNQVKIRKIPHETKKDLKLDLGLGDLIPGKYDDYPSHEIHIEVKKEDSPFKFRESAFKYVSAKIVNSFLEELERKDKLENDSWKFTKDYHIFLVGNRIVYYYKVIATVKLTKLTPAENFLIMANKWNVGKILKISEESYEDWNPYFYGSHRFNENEFSHFMKKIHDVSEEIG